MDRTPKSGEIYRHFKNKLYQIVTVAIHSETGEPLVIYQALYGDYKVYARPLSMFVEEVDREKYPDVVQTYRFEKVERTELDSTSNDKCRKEILQNESEMQEKPAEYSSESKIRKSKTVEEKLAEFFDTDDMETRYNILVSLKGEVNDLMINNMAVVLDVVIPDGEIEVRYEELKRCIRTKQKYENSRMR